MVLYCQGLEFLGKLLMSKTDCEKVADDSEQFCPLTPRLIRVGGVHVYLCQANVIVLCFFISGKCRCCDMT
jgi:hypothetical protein